jgi:hypothetical protein
MFLLPHQRVVRGVKMSSNLLLLIEISGMQHLGQKKGQKVTLLTFYLFMMFIQNSRSNQTLQILLVSS